MCVCIYIYIYIHICVIMYIYIYIYRERERDVYIRITIPFVQSAGLAGAIGLPRRPSWPSPRPVHRHPKAQKLL